MSGNILSIVGARPQFIKLFPISKKLRECCNEKIIHTGQHFDQEMSDLFFSQLKIPKPDINLNINQGSHAQQTGRMVMELENFMIDYKPDLVIVFGDTNTTLAGALNAAKLHIPIVHIEAGLRSYNKQMPEEINRIIVDHTSDYLFAPTLTAMDNLRDEGLASKSYLTGDIMVDSLQDIMEKARHKKTLTSLNIDEGYLLMTLHRPYNVDDPYNLAKIFLQLEALDHNIVFPVHPRTKKIIDTNKIKLPKNITIIKPQGYLDFINLEVNADKIITDSGGIQKEAYILQKPCITIRTETEWVETIQEGWNILINPYDDLFESKIKDFNPVQERTEIFGSNVAEKMINIINEILLDNK